MSFQLGVHRFYRELVPGHRYVFIGNNLYEVIGLFFPKVIPVPVYEIKSEDEVKHVKEALWRRGFVVDFEDRYEGKLRWTEEAEAA